MISFLIKNLFVRTAAVLAFVISGVCFAQQPADLMTQKWPAKRIKVPGTGDNMAQVCFFRKEIKLSEKPATFKVHITGDYRYKFFVNGTLVSVGPARSDYRRQMYETVDLAGYLTSGDNVLCAVAWNYGDLKPAVQNSPHCSFVLQGATEAEQQVNTNGSWSCIKSEAHSFLKPDSNIPWYTAPPGEKLDYKKYPTGWDKPGFDAGKWKKAEVSGDVIPEGYAKAGTGTRVVTPRTIPAMTSKIERFKSLRSTIGGAAPPPGFPMSPLPFKVPGNTHMNFVVDNEAITVAYPVIKFSGGKGARVRIEYAEAFYEQDPANPLNMDMRNRSKGNRNVTEGKIFMGLEDEFYIDGTEHEFTTLWWKSYRYMRVYIDTEEDPLIIKDLYAVQSVYPFQNMAAFSSDNPELRTILDVGKRTVRVCANETFMDCAYYEQLQYIGDTRIQALVALFEFGDDKLMRNALMQFNESIGSEGLTMSRFPTGEPQFIPGFSLWWIGMIHDYARYRNDPEFIKSLLPGARKVIAYFESQEHGNHLLKKMPHWNFIDWTSKWKGGTPPLSETGNSSVIDLQYLLGLQYATYLEENFGDKSLAEKYAGKIDLLKKTIKDTYYNSSAKLYAETAGGTTYSQHSQALAVLTGLSEGPEATSLMEKTLIDASLVPCSIYFKFYLNSAVTKASLGDKYIDLLGEWRNQLALGLTTWAEAPEPARSDCHAWGSSPNIEVYRTVLGIDSDAPGFEKVRIEPHLGDLKQAAGKIPHPAGEISVSYSVHGKGKIEANITLPEGVHGTFVHLKKEHHLHPGHNHLRKF